MWRDQYWRAYPYILVYSWVSWLKSSRGYHWVIPASFLKKFIPWKKELAWFLGLISSLIFRIDQRTLVQLVWLADKSGRSMNGGLGHRLDKVVVWFATYDTALKWHKENNHFMNKYKQSLNISHNFCYVYACQNCTVVIPKMWFAITKREDFCELVKTHLHTAFHQNQVREWGGGGRYSNAITQQKIDGKLPNKPRP